MKAYLPKSFVLGLLSVLLLISGWGCSNGTKTADGGIGGTGIISRGTITAFGSILVNGTDFDTSNAAIIVEREEIGVGDDIARNNLDIGRVVTVTGRVSKNGTNVTAKRVTYNDNVEGPVESMLDIDPATKEFVVLGQHVITNVITKFKGTAFDTIALNDVLEVSGFFDDTGAIRATFIEKTGEFTPGAIVEVKGFAANLDTDLETFKINDLTVDYALADTSGLPGGVPAEGLLVEVDGRLDAAGGVMLADEIVLEDEWGVLDSDQIEILGFVTDFVSVFEFTVGNQEVQTDAATVFIDGTSEDVAPGAKIEAEGSLSDGILFAHEIEFWGPDQIEVEGFVTDFVTVFEFTVGNQVVHTDAQTVFENISPEDIALGVRLEVKGSLVGSILVADKVSFEEN